MLVENLNPSWEGQSYSVYFLWISYLINFKTFLLIYYANKFGPLDWEKLDLYLEYNGYFIILHLISLIF